MVEAMAEERKMARLTGGLCTGTILTQTNVIVANAQWCESDARLGCHCSV